MATSEDRGVYEGGPREESTRALGVGSLESGDGVLGGHVEPENF